MTITDCSEFIHAKDFQGVVFDGQTILDAPHQAMLDAIGAVGAWGQTLIYPSGRGRFWQTVGPYPFGMNIIGQGVTDLERGDGQVGSPQIGGTLFSCEGVGIGVQLGHSTTSNQRNAGSFRRIEVLGQNPGNEASGQYNEVGIAIAGDTGVEIAECRTGGFKYHIDLDGCEGCTVRRVTLDGYQGPLGYPIADALADRGTNSAFGVRIGAYKSQQGGAANGNTVEKCLFQATGWGCYINAEGMQNIFRDCVFENDRGFALVDNCLGIRFEHCIGEGPDIATVKVIGTVYSLALQAVMSSPSVPLVLLEFTCYRAIFTDVNCRTYSVIPVQGAYHLVGASLVGCSAPYTGPFAGKMLDVDTVLSGMIECVVDGGGKVGVNCQPESALDVRGNAIRTQQTYTPTGSDDPYGNIGDHCWDAANEYRKTAQGWAVSPRSLLPPTQSPTHAEKVA